MNKKRIHHYWNKAKAIKTWQLVLLAILFALLSVYALRQNSLGLEPKIEAVTIADKENINIEESVNELGDYVLHHMNARLPRPIQLEHSYKRAVEKAYDNALSELHGGNLLEEAKAVCAELGVVVSAGPQCIQDYLDKNWNPDRGSLIVDLPPVSLFTYEFISPVWSPDLAGWSIVITIVLVIAIISRLLAERVIRNALKDHQ